MDPYIEVILLVAYIGLIGYIFRIAKKIYNLSGVKEFMYIAIGMLISTLLPISTLSFLHRPFTFSTTEVIIYKFIIIVVIVLGENLLIFALYSLSEGNTVLHFFNQISLTLIIPAIIWEFVVVDSTRSISVSTDPIIISSILIVLVFAIIYEVFIILMQIWQYTPKYSPGIWGTIALIFSISSIACFIYSVVITGDVAYILLGIMMIYIPIALVFAQDPFILLTSPPQPIMLLIYDKQTSIALSSYKFVKQSITNSNISLVAGLFASVEAFIQGISKSQAKLQHIEMDQFSIIFESTAKFEFVYFVEKYTKVHHALLRIIAHNTSTSTSIKISNTEISKLDQLVMDHFKAQTRRLNMELYKLTDE